MVTASDDFEFRLINPTTGLPDTVLGDIQTWQLSPVVSDAGTVQITLPRNGANYSAVQMDMDLAVFYKGVELGNLRSTMEQRSYDDANVNEQGDIATITCRTSLARLQRAVVYPSGWPTATDPPSYTFTSATPGFIMLTLIGDAKLRGTIPEIVTSSFTATHDSNGVVWATSLSLQWDAQTDYLQVINDLQSYGQCDAEMNVYTLNLYNYQTLGTDKTLLNPPVIIRKGRDLTQSSVQESTRDLRTIVLASGSNNLYVESSYAPAVSVRGRRETGTSASGITDSAQLTALGNQYAESVAADIIGRTNALVFDDTSPIPGATFDLGDWVWTDVDGTLYRQRVIQWSLSCSQDGTLTGTTAMDNIFGEFLTRLQARVNAIENGATITGGSEPDKVNVITSPPAVPISLSAGTDTYLDNQGHTFSYIDAVWAQVTEDQTGADDPNVAGYYLRYVIHGNTPWTVVTMDANTFTYFIGGLAPDTEYDLQVGCFDSQANFSGWSGTYTITTASDVTPPNEPSTPVVASTLGQLAITWDGKDSLGGNMPGDYDHTTVYVSSSSPTFTPSPANEYTTMHGSGTVQVPGTVLTYGTTYYARLIAYDQSGNASAASAAGSSTLAQVVSTDIQTGQVGLNNLSFSAAGNLVDDGSFEDPNWQAVRNTAFGGTHFSITNTTADNGLWSVEHVGTGGQTTETVTLSTIPANTGQVFMAAADFKSSSLVSSSMILSVVANFLNSSNASIGTATLTSNWTSPGTNDNNWHQRISGTGGTAPAGTTSVQFQLVSTNHTAGQIYVDAVEIRQQVDNLLVANAAITDAKIGTVSANKIITGTLSAGVIISGSMGTAASGQRVVMDGTGFHSYDASGNKIFDVSSSSSIVTVAASAGVAKIVVETATLYPTIKMYDTSNSNYAFLNAVNNDGNTACIAMQGGNFTSGSHTLANQFTASGVNVGCSMKTIDTSTQATQGGLVQTTPSGVNANVQTAGAVDGGVMTLTNTSSLLGMFPQGATHGGQLLMTYDSGNSDAKIEIDGYRGNSGAFAPAPQEYVIGGDVAGLTGGSAGASLSYGTTMYSGISPIAVYSCGTFTSVPASNVSSVSTTGFGFSLSAATPAAWSVLFWAFRNR